jgi:hypothetical protein
MGDMTERKWRGAKVVRPGAPNLAPALAMGSLGWSTMPDVAYNTKDSMSQGLMNEHPHGVSGPGQCLAEAECSLGFPDRLFHL